MIAMPIESRSRPYLVYSNNQPVRKENRPYQAIGGALAAWRTGKRECLLAGPAGTGKSRAILQKLHFCAQKYPGMRAIICRKTRKSISQSAMVTYEKKVLPEGWLDKYVHFSTVDQQYEYANGSIIAVGGLDDSTKVMSSEWDMIYPQEATELLEEDWQALVTRLRNNVMPYQQLIADCNPSYPTHWLKLRCDRHETQMLYSTHADNPSLTPEYLESLRSSLHGVMKERLFEGKWAAASGMVYDEWNPATHIATKKQLIDWGILYPNGTINRWKVKRFVAGVDWGYTNPGVINIFAVDNDDRLYLFREVYRTKKRIEWWVEQAKALNSEFGGISEWICDPAEPAYIADFCEAGLDAIGAVNDIIPGIDAAKERLEVRGNGYAGFYTYEFSLQDRDELRDEVHQPVSFEGEINAYVWPKTKDGQPVKEVPVKLNDHSLDNWRYVCKHLKNIGIGQMDEGTANALRSYVGY
jgi:PBSX family phage terminase large subunit